MSEPLKFEPKKTVNERLRGQMEKQDEAIMALLHNDEVTRGILSRGFLGRVKWLILGK